MSVYAASEDAPFVFGAYATHVDHTTSVTTEDSDEYPQLAPLRDPSVDGPQDHEEGGGSGGGEQNGASPSGRAAFGC